MTNTYIKSRVDDCRVMDLGKHTRPNGNITVVEGELTVPFDLSRVYYLYDVPGGVSRGGHAHYDLYQLIVAASGSFDVVLDDGENQRTVSLNRPYQALLLVPGIWRELHNFSSGAVCLVLASLHYDPEDYIYDHQQFIHSKQQPTT